VILEMEFKNNNLKLPYSTSELHKNRVLNIIQDKLKAQPNKIFDEKIKTEEIQTDIRDVNV
jgi:hypothetical protein